jgi:hypothetical protein
VKADRLMGESQQVIPILQRQHKSVKSYEALNSMLINTTKLLK